MEQDERDNGRRRLLNLGHTVGHALEQLSGYKIPHGRAVAAGIDIMASACVKHGLLAQSVADELSALRRQYHLEMDGPWSSAELAAAMKQDKKIDGGRISLAAIRDIGDCFIMDLPVDELEAWFS